MNEKPTTPTPGTAAGGSEQNSDNRTCPACLNIFESRAKYVAHINSSKCPYHFYSNTTIFKIVHSSASLQALPPLVNSSGDSNKKNKAQKAIIPLKATPNSTNRSNNGSQDTRTTPIEPTTVSSASSQQQQQEQTTTTNKRRIENDEVEASNKKQKTSNEEPAVVPISDFHQFLNNLDLLRYEAKLTEEEVSVSDLSYCDEEDLKELGLAKGARLRILGAFGKRTGSSTTVEKSEEDVNTFLKSLELSKYEAKLKEEEVRMSDLRYCNEEDLKEMGFVKGPRIRILGCLGKKDKTSGTLLDFNSS